MDSQNTNQNHDVIVIGGGPAGSTFSTLMQEKGWNVLMLEKDHHPRFHIGESLLPMTLPILDRLGVQDRVDKIGIVKYGAEFNSSSQPGVRETFYFDSALDKKHPHAYEVRRSEFDELLFRNAREKGVDAQEGVKITNVDFNPDTTVTVTAHSETGEIRNFKSRYLVDATGRDTFLSRRLKLKEKSGQHSCAAIFGHFENVERRSGKDEGNISIYWFDHGWFWMIPLRDGAMSVGAVCYPEYLKTRDCSTEKFLWRTIQMVPEIHERMKDAVLSGEARATGNFTYNSTRMFGEEGRNYLLIGDAYAFIDPVFSSGIHIALTGAMKAADTIDACLRNPADAQRFLGEYGKEIDDALKTFSWLIHRFNSPAIQKLFMAPANNFRIQEAIVSLLAGDIYRDTPVKSRFVLFKLLYYSTFLANLPRAWATHRRRKLNIDVSFTGGTTPQDRLDE